MVRATRNIPQLRAVVACAALLAAGCVSPHYSVATDVDAAAWREPATLLIANTDTTTLRDLSLFLRCNDRMPQDTLTVKIALITPDSLRCEEDFVVVVPVSRAPAALARETVVPYRRRVCFSRTGDYRMTITPRHAVKGVEAIGIHIVKSE